MKRGVQSNVRYSRVMSRERSESVQSVATTLSTCRDSTPLYYCDKDVFNKPTNTTRRAERSLFVAAGLTLLFIVSELVGGYIANSLAIMTDAGHMLSDLISFLISIVAIKLARKKPTKRLSFGFHRAEVLGALASVFLIWVLTAVLVYMAAMRIVHDDFEVNADVMLITAGISVLFNILMGAVLHFGNATHSHFGATHSHNHHPNSDNSIAQKVQNGSVSSSSTECSNSSSPEHKRNINVRAALVHVIGDLVQSVGVLVAAIVIKCTAWRLADPICTFLFSILVMITTVTVVRDAVLVLMEATPRHIHVDTVHDDLCAIEGVRDAHSLRIWSLTMDRTAVSVHLDTDKDCDSTHVVHQATDTLRTKYNIDYITVQVQCVCSRSISMQTFVPLTPSPSPDHADDIA